MHCQAQLLEVSAEMHPLNIFADLNNALVDHQAYRSDNAENGRKRENPPLVSRYSAHRNERTHWTSYWAGWDRNATRKTATPTHASSQTV
jgi:hypothetical protein